MRHAVVLGLLALAACAPAGPSAGRDAAREGGETTPSTAQPAPPPAAPAQPTPPAPGAGASEGDSARLARLEREARTLAHADGCGSAAQCRMAPVGSRPCGGPRHYLPYCAATTDTAQLFAKLRELARAESAYNEERGLASTCEFRQPPRIELVGGTCRAAAEAELRDALPR